MQVEKYVSADGLELAYKIQGSGPFVTLIHGIGADHASWDAIASQLEAHFTVLHADLRGHGASSLITRCSLDDFVSDVDALLDAVGVQKTHLVGFSLGGLIAQKYAVENSARLNRLALISSVAERTDEERARVLKRADQIDREGIAAVVAAAEDRWFTPAFKAANPQRVAYRLEQLVKNDHRSYAAAYRVFAAADRGIAFDRISVPTLVMTGENDPGSSPRMSRLLHEKIAGSQLRILPELRHSVLLEAPDLIAGLLLEFLQPE
ncbi:alpha/beta fold hydrolase [Paraburkholderia sp. Cy-641]|uniref:alpha/beta fold hydrolase n=1 Tax=Paraburkholderia sp. Cy-641 TaxID=2608337 RepID=UPI00141DEC5E|nr:alpha/beta fold hydrolase [Paraburkholderia sp. Cy-641]NIF75919.1 alpha/beta fold hydrolase [Paraburkholderia sp. Cy-641]